MSQISSERIEQFVPPMASRLYQPIILDSQQMANYHKRMNIVNRY
jgi:hypothetical protein